MLRYLRENTGNWIIKIFLGIIVIVFVFLGVGSFGSKRGDSVATVNDESITMKEYQRSYRQMVEQMRSRFGDNLNDDLLKMLNVKQQALDALIDERLVMLEAERLGVIVSDRELQQSLLAIPAFQKEGRFDMDQYKRVLGLNAMTPETFEEGHVNTLRQQKVREIVLANINVSDLEARNWYLFQQEKVAVDYLAFLPDTYKDIQPDTEQVKKFYEENKETFKSELQVKAAYLEFSPEDYKDEVSVNDDQVKAYYQENQETFKTPEQVEARHILIKTENDATQEQISAAEKEAMEVYLKAVGGEDFEALAKKYSQGPTKDNGGYLGKFEKNTMVKPFADQAFSMAAGDISKPVKTQFGWHVIKVIDKFEASIKKYDEVAQKIRKDLESEEMQNTAYDRAGEAFDAVIDGDDFDQVAMIAQKKIVTTEAFKNNGNGLKVKDKAGFAREAFSLTRGNISDVKQLGDTYYLIKVLENIEPVVLTFDAAATDARKQLVVKLQRERAQQQAGQYLKTAVESKDIKAIATEHSLTLKTTPLFSRTGRVNDVGDSSRFVEAGFSLNENNMVYPEMIETDKGFFVLQFKEKKLPDEDEIVKNLTTTKEQVLRNKQMQSFQAWMTGLRKNNKITYNAQLLN